MSEVTVSVPDEVLAALNVAPEELGAELRLAAALKLFEMGRLSAEAAACLAGIARTHFLSKLGDYGVDTFRLSERELSRDTRLAEVIRDNSPLQYFAEPQ